jgi:magnesium-transporting ATPase (P-type)
MKYLSLSIPGIDGQSKTNIVPPSDIHAGGPMALNSIISTALNIAILGAIIVCLFMLVWAGFDWITSEGDKQKVAKARQRLAMAIIGLIVVFISFMVMSIIYTFFFGHSFNFLSLV